MMLLCLNDKCKNYYEEYCELDLRSKRTKIDESGKCANFEAGVHDGYTQQADDMIDNLKVQMQLD